MDEEMMFASIAIAIVLAVSLTILGCFNLNKPTKIDGCIYVSTKDGWVHDPNCQHGGELDGN